MSRHALHPARPRRRPLRWLLAGVLLLALAGTLVIKLDATPSRLREMAATAPLIGATCPSRRLTTTSVALTVAPEIRSTVTRSLARIDQQMLADHECVTVTIQSQAPAATLEGAQILPLDRAPDIWIPDSSLWVSRVPWQLNRTGSFASSPVVIASSKATLDQLGWTADKPPSWQVALSGARPLALPHIAANAAGLSAVIALWQSLGQSAVAQQALAGAVLAAGRADVPSETDAIEAAQTGSAKAPLLPTSVQAVTVANTVASTRSKLAYVEPTGGTPSLDYPVLTTVRTGPTSGTATTVVEPSGARERAVQAVIRQLFSSQAAGLARSAGFEVTAGRQGATTAATAGDASGGATPFPSPTGSPVDGLTAPELAALVDRITLLSAPTRQLVIFDLSKSMAAQAGNGQTRIAFAATAATLAGNLLTDQSQVGVWGFARDLAGTKDFVKIEPLAKLGTREGSTTHRAVLNQQMAGAAARLGGNGTALYSTAVAGMKEMTKLYDPRAGNAVVIFTDGANDDDGGPTLKATLAALKKVYDPKKPVRLLCIGIGDGVNMKELGRLSAQAGGVAYLAKDPKQLPTVLFQALNSRK